MTPVVHMNLHLEVPAEKARDVLALLGIAPIGVSITVEGEAEKVAGEPKAEKPKTSRARKTTPEPDPEPTEEHDQDALKAAAEKAAAEKAAAEKAEAEKAAASKADKAPSLDDCRAAVNAWVHAKQANVARERMKEMGYSNVNEIPEDGRAAFVARMSEGAPA